MADTLISSLVPCVPKMPTDCIVQIVPLEADGRWVDSGIACSEFLHGNSFLLMDLVIRASSHPRYYEGWNFNSGNYLFTTDTK